jgi:hypothetical protein
MRENLRLCLGLIKTFSFAGCIKLSVFVHRVSPVAGDWLADLLGVTAAFQRGHRWLVESDSWEAPAEPGTALQAISPTEL